MEYFEAMCYIFIVWDLLILILLGVLVWCAFVLIKLVKTLILTREPFNERDPLYKNCLLKWGYQAQLNMVNEECGELITAINHYRRGRVPLDKVMEESADAFLMIEEISTLDKPKFMYYLNSKAERVKKKLEG